MYSQDKEMNSILGGRNSSANNRGQDYKASMNQGVEEFDERNMAANMYARSTLKKHATQVQSSKKASSFNNYFDRAPKQFLKSFREHESFSRRALNLGTKMQRKYD